MKGFIIKIYDLFKKSPVTAWAIFVVLTACIVTSFLTLTYKEDISDFLPLDESNQTALSVYQEISGANKIYAIISSKNGREIDPASLTVGVDDFVDKVESSDSLNYISSLTKSIDFENLTDVVDEVYSNIPLYLTDEDYARMDSLMTIPGYADRQLQEDKQLLMFPSSSMVSQSISKDPLGLFAPVLGRLQQKGMPSQFETYDGYILSSDGQKAIVIFESAFGAHESENNNLLVTLLDEAARQTEKEHNDIDVHIIGGPVIAVSNANQIKSDSILAVCIAGVLILLLLIYVFRNIRNILLIVVSVGWGWLFAMGIIAMFYQSVSIIVIGIASVILGISINYPLHLIDHLKDSSHPRQALKEIISPLIVGNVTTVGAFLCLVPLNSPALHDLGLFASLLLVGTILFVLIFLPHAVSINKRDTGKIPMLITRLASVSIENKKWMVWTILILTAIFGVFSLRTEFDSDMRNINYMTENQKSDMEYFKELFSTEKNSEDIYIVSSGPSWEDALIANEEVDDIVSKLVDEGDAKRGSAASSFLKSSSTQAARIEKWNEFKSRYANILTDTLEMAATKQGFNPEAFQSFNELLSKSFKPTELNTESALVSLAFSANITLDKSTGRHSIVQTIEVPVENVEAIKSRLEPIREFGANFFDVRSMNGSIANTLSNDFNYIGIACGCIVFIFLWISLGSIELAMVSFLPMAVSWLWILGIMGILGIKFNIVNIILATFIFGQGDDYTIFMTEGLTYEFAYRKKLLTSYKNSIIVSALIMFIGIGTLIFAKHPALRSLGEVTVVGMLSVVLMAYLFPPLVFNWLVRKNGQVRYRPITLKKILCTAFCALVFFLQLVSAYVIGFSLFVVTKSTPRKRLWFHRYNCSVFRFDIKRMPGIKFVFKNLNNETFDTPSVIICNHQSLLDSFCMMFLSPKIILLANEHIRVNPIIRLIFKWSSFISVADGNETIVANAKELVKEGYSIAVFPEGIRPERGNDKLLRFHKGAFHLAEELSLDILPVYLYGVSMLMPRGSALSNGGLMYLEVGKRISNSDMKAMGNLAIQAKNMRVNYKEHLSEIQRSPIAIENFKDVVFDRYLYKGREIEVKAMKDLKHIYANIESISQINTNLPIVVVDSCGLGEMALLLALIYQGDTIYCYIPHEESREIFNGCIVNFASNIRVLDEHDFDVMRKQSVNFIEIASQENMAEPLREQAYEIVIPN